MALRAATGRLLSQISRGVPRIFGIEITYYARAEKLLQIEPEIIKGGDSHLIKEFREFKDTVQYNQKLNAPIIANSRSVDRSDATMVAATIAMAAYYFSLPKKQKPQLEERAMPPPLPCKFCYLASYLFR